MTELLAGPRMVWVLTSETRAGYGLVVFATKELAIAALYETAEEYSDYDGYEAVIQNLNAGRMSFELSEDWHGICKYEVQTKL